LQERRKEEETTARRANTALLKASDSDLQAWFPSLANVKGKKLAALLQGKAEEIGITLTSLSNKYRAWKVNFKGISKYIFKKRC
jgi:uncharacterized protein YpbB